MDLSLVRAAECDLLAHSDQIPSMEDGNYQFAMFAVFKCISVLNIHVDAGNSDFNLDDLEFRTKYLDAVQIGVKKLVAEAPPDFKPLLIERFNSVLMLIMLS